MLSGKKKKGQLALNKTGVRQVVVIDTLAIRLARAEKGNVFQEVYGYSVGFCKRTGSS
jgi:hypothetical protein